MVDSASPVGQSRAWSPFLGGPGGGSHVERRGESCSGDRGSTRTGVLRRTGWERGTTRGGGRATDGAFHDVCRGNAIGSALRLRAGAARSRASERAPHQNRVPV